MNVAIITAAGQSKRMGKTDKQMISLSGYPVLVYSVNTFEESLHVDKFIITASPERVKEYEDLLTITYPFTKLHKVIAGGKERQDSVWFGLQALKKLSPEIVVIHDGARPFVSEELLEKAVRTARQEGSAVIGYPVTDTVKQIAKDGFVEKTVSRDNLWVVQTPQVFQFSLIYKAYEQAIADNFYGTDDSSLVERMGCFVKLVLGSKTNIKITVAEDLQMAEAIIHRRLHGD